MHKPILAFDVGGSASLFYDLVSIERASLGNNAEIIGATYHFIKMQTKRTK